MAPPALDDDSCLAERAEDFAGEQLVAKARASTMFWPCETKISTCRDFAPLRRRLQPADKGDGSLRPVVAIAQVTSRTLPQNSWR
jgi:hypothetical protein